MKKFPNFELATVSLLGSMRYVSQLVHTEKWQGVDITQRPEMATYELLNYSLQVPVLTEDLGELGRDIKPNLPWADDHFMERVCGYPLNPGTEWENWPYGKSAAKFLDKGIFNHSYAERYWPRYAGKVPPSAKGGRGDLPLGEGPNRGIRQDYGDLDDVVTQLVKEPLTRQAYLPMFFPEDTGGAAGGRVPCSLGYHFMMRNGFLHVVYQLRSCDLVRHFRDDCYLTVRLLLWVLDECRKQDPSWNNVKPGIYTMHITSLHMFKGDFQPTFGSPR